MLSLRNSVRALSAASRSAGFRPVVRYFSTEEIERDVIEADIIVIGGGPSGIAAAIRAKQYANDSGKELNVILVEKGAEIGSHVLSGNVFEPRAFNELFPKWKSMEDRPPLDVLVKSDQFFVLSKNNAMPLPSFLLPPEIHNEGNYIVSLADLTRWMGRRAEELGVEVYSGFAADQAIISKGSDGRMGLTGVTLKDTGVNKKGEQTDEYMPGPLLKAKQFIVAEGAKGSVTEQLVEALGLQGASPQSFSLGVKEIWKVPAELHQEGTVVHTVGWPLTNDEYGGAFLYHAANQEIYLGIVIGLDYQNPHLSPYKELQALKTHPKLKGYFDHPESECVSYGARVLQAGGIQAMHKPSFPGGVLVGCGLGTLNMPKIKGTHTAMKSGMIAGEEVAKRLLGLPEDYDVESLPVEVDTYGPALKNSWVGEELSKVRNVKAASKLPMIPGLKKRWGMTGVMGYAGFALHLTKGKEPWTFQWTKEDRDYTEPASKHIAPSHYTQLVKPDGKVTFDILENLNRAQVNHSEDQPAHLKVRAGKENIPVGVSLEKFAGPEQNFCPAKVYEFVPSDDPKDEVNGKPGMRLQINAQNCVHCKTCAIKTPEKYIKWTVPEGTGGPNYQNM